jgi:hypothetical protein
LSQTRANALSLSGAGQLREDHVRRQSPTILDR